jgi:pyruvate dehydrogenase kinase 2/3/4
MTQTIKNHKLSNGELPPIRIWISDGTEDVSFKIDAEDGGMPTSDLPKVWSYTYPSFTTINNPPSPKYPFKEYCIPASFSLPFSRTLSRYFGGDLEIAPAGIRYLSNI